MSEILEADDVLSMVPTANPVNNRTVKVSQVLQKIRETVGNPIYEWIEPGEPGAECEVLRASTAGWRKGRLRLRVEFIPDKPEPPQQAQLEDSETLFLPSSDA